MLKRLVICVSLVGSSVLCHAREPMAQYGESYVGPKTMTVEVAPLADATKALIKIVGVNHAWNGKVFLAQLRRGSNQRVEYVIAGNDGERVVMEENPTRGTILYLPGIGDARLDFDRGSSFRVQPEHLLTEYENQSGAK